MPMWSVQEVWGIKKKHFFEIFSGTFFGGDSLSRFFRELFFSRPAPPCSPPRGTTPPCSPPGGLPPCRAIFFSFFFLKNIFFSKTGTWVTFLVDWGQRKKKSTFFWFRPLGDPFWDPLLTRFGPILVTLGDYRGHK